MKTIGFTVSSKENERRRALLPVHILKIKNKSMLFFEKGYGEVLGISDDEYEKAGAHTCSKEEVYCHPVICNPKAPEPHERNFYQDGQTLFGWIHAVQGRAIVDFLLSKKMSGIAWEDMFDTGRHIFWENNEICGEAAVVHSLRYFGQRPCESKVAVIGRGNCARGAMKTFSRLGAEVIVYDRTSVHHLRNEIDQFDIVVNAVFWDVFRTDHLIYRTDLKRMKPGSMIIDISCDDKMGIETSHATTIEDPVYVVDGVTHYAVDHTPAIFYRSATRSISAALYPFIDDLIEGHFNPVIADAECIKNGNILNQKIIQFQNR
jgi:N5-(carboxyethyl)ornithine synthase